MKSSHNRSNSKNSNKGSNKSPQSKNKKNIEVKTQPAKSLPINFSNDSNIQEYQKIIDARYLILVVRSDWRLPRSDWVLWIMNHMFRPLTQEKIQSLDYRIVELTDEKIPNWAESFYNENSLKSHPNMLDISQFNEIRKCASPSPYKGSFPVQETTIPLYRIVPQTQIYTVYDKYTLAFLLDVSDSVATIDPISQRCLIDDVFDSFEKCLLGAIETFSIQSSFLNELYQFQPELHISVLADCSQEVSIQPVIEKNKQTTKVILHDIILTPGNAYELIKYVKWSILNIKSKLPEVSIGYQDIEFTDNTDTSSRLEAQFESDDNQISFLQAGLLTLKLLPQDSSPTIILFTDGVAEYGQEDNVSDLRAMSKNGIRLVAIQVGNNYGFTPACSFGCVPDNESLRFLATATGGKFIYADDCPEVVDVPAYDVDEILDGLKLPNFYHHLLLIQEAGFQRSRQDNKDSIVNIGKERAIDTPRMSLLNSQLPSSNNETINVESNFPWTFSSRPPVTDFLLTRYRDYALPLETFCILNARLREGFFIERIVLSGNKQNKVEKLHINLAMTWLPKVVIQYRIKAQLPSDYKTSHTYLNRTKYIRVEMNILSSAVFALAFVNIDSTHGSSNCTGVLRANVLNLHNFLNSIFATDDTLKSLSTLTTKFPVLKGSRDRAYNALLSNKEIVQKLDSDSVKQIWDSFEHHRLEYVSNGLFDRYSSMLTVIPTNGSNRESRYHKNFEIDVNELNPLIVGHLGFMCLTGAIFIKYLQAHKIGQHAFPSFCILRIAKITGYLVWTRLAFVNVRNSVRKEISQLHSSIDFRLNTESGNSLWIKSCKRPLHNLLVKNQLMNSQAIFYRRFDLASASKHYLNKSTRNWLNQIEPDDYFVENGLPFICDLLYSLLIQAKLAQNFIKISSIGSDTVILYKEYTILQGKRLKSFSVQYELNKDSVNTQVSSIVWSEPLTNSQFSDESKLVVDKILKRDESVVSNILSFDQIHKACRSNIQIFSEPLRLRSLVLTSVALVSEYAIPKLQYGQSDVEHLRRDIKLLGSRKIFIPSTPNFPYSVDLNFSLEEIESFSQLTTSCLLYQYYLETSILAVSDMVVSSAFEDPCGIPVELLSGQGIVSPKDASLKWGFAKLISPKAFSILFVPNAIDMLEAYIRVYENEPDYNGPMSIKLWTFECIRENLNQAQLSLDLDENDLKDLNNGPYYSNFYPVVPTSEALFKILPTLSRIEFWTDWSKPQPNISNNVHQLQSTYDDISGRAFVQTLYNSMLQGNKVEAANVNLALDLCTQMNLFIDITDYLNLKTEASRRGFSHDRQDYYDSKLQEKINRLLAKHFGIVATCDDGLESMVYYFNAIELPNTVPDTGDKSVPESPKEAKKPEPLTALQKFLKHSSSALFMKLKFCFTNPNMSPNSRSFCSERLPTSYKVPDSEDSKNPLDYSPAKIGTKVSPLESTDGTTTYIQFSLYIPKSLAQINGTIGNTVDELKNLDKKVDLLKHPNAKLFFDSKQLSFLGEIASKLDFLFKEEVLYGLLAWDPVDAPMLRFIEKKLFARHSNENFPYSMSFDMQFVDNAKGMELFNEEIQSIFLFPYCVRRTEEYFYLMSQKKSISHYTNKYCPIMEVSDEEDPFIQAEPPLDDNLPEPIVVPNFWFLFTATEDQIRVSFFSKRSLGISASTLFAIFRAKASAINYKINQTILLDELESTRVCSKYLLGPDPCDDPLEKEDYLDDGQDDSFDSMNEGEGDYFSTSFLSTLELQPPAKPTRKRFKPGQFECSELYSVAFQLHWRLSPNQALNGILASVMYPLSISNRQNVFVIRTKTSVFYLRIFEEKLPVSRLEDDISMDRSGHSSERNSHMNFEESSPMTTSHPSPKPFSTSSVKRIELNMPMVPCLRTTLYPITRASAEGSRCLVIKVFGIDPPGTEITEEFVNLIETRLNNNITLNVISSYLSRHANSKLTQDDVYFIFPIKQHPKPITTIEYYLPSFVLNPILALLYIKQNIRQYTHLLGGAEAKQQYKRFCELKYNHIFCKSESTECDCFVGEFLFFYNCIATRTPSPLESLLGQGIGLACMTMVDATTGELIIEQENQNHQHLGFKPLLTGETFDIAQLLEGSKESKSKPGRFLLHVDIWTVGGVNPEEFRSKLLSTIRQSMCSYVLECCTKNFLIEMPTSSEKLMARAHSESDKILTEHSLNSDEKLTPIHNINFESRLIKPSSAIIHYGVDIGSPSMTYFEINCTLSYTLMKLVITKIYDWLSDYHTQCTPVVVELSKKGLGSLVNVAKLGSESVQNHLKEIEPYKFLLLSGLSEFQTKSSRQNHFWAQLNESDLLPSRKSSTDDIMSVRSGQQRTVIRKEKPLDDLYFHPACFINHNCLKYPGMKIELSRNFMVSILIENRSMKVYTFNMNKSFTDQFKNFAERLLAWQASRTNLLDFVLHQKMGLFHQKFDVSEGINLQHGSSHNLNENSRSNSIHSHKMHGDIHKLNLLVKNFSPARLRVNNQGLDLNLRNKLVVNDHMDSSSTLEKNSIKSSEDPRFLHSRQPSSNLDRVLFMAQPDIFPDFNPQSADYLQRHGYEFIDQYHRQQTDLSTYLETVTVLYYSLKNPDTAVVKIEPEELTALKLNSHLVHFWRVPFFKVLQSIGIASNHNFNSRLHQSSSFVIWYKETMTSMMVNYRCYLERLGLQAIGQFVDPSEATSFPNIYYYRWIEGQLILLELGVKDMLTSINVYSVFPPTDPFSQTTLFTPTFLKQLKDFKRQLHIHSFLYDFHIQHLQDWLLKKLITPDLNYLGLISTLLKFPAFNRGLYSRNAIGVGSLPNSDLVSFELYKFILSFAERCSMNCIMYNQKPIGFFFSEQLPNKVKRTIVVTHLDTSNSSDGFFSLNYYVLYVYNDNFTSFPNDPNHDSIDLGPDVSSVTDSIHFRLTQAKQISDKSKIWNRLVSSSSLTLNSDDLLSLITDFYPIDLKVVEPTILQFVEFEVDWHKLLDKLVLTSPRTCCDYTPLSHAASSELPARHVLLFNPESKYHLLYFQMSSTTPKTPTLCLAISHDPRQQLKSVELEHLTNTLNSCFYFLWETLHGPILEDLEELDSPNLQPVSKQLSTPSDLNL